MTREFSSGRFGSGAGYLVLAILDAAERRGGGVSRVAAITHSNHDECANRRRGVGSCVAVDGRNRFVVAQHAPLSEWLFVELGELVLPHLCQMEVRFHRAVGVCLF
jgi:hypothetical protein